MSGGEQQMLTIARTLMGNPLVVLLDEPSEGIAPVIVEQIADTIVELKKRGLSILLSEQNVHFAELVSRPRLHAGERPDPLGRDHGRACRKRGSAAQLPDAVSKTGELMTSVTPTEQAGSVMAAEGDRSGVTILKLRYALEDKPGAVATALFGVQHVLVMFTGMIAAPLVIGQLLDLPPELHTNMLTGVMLGCGIGTTVSALGFGFVGARLPIVLGTHSVYIVAVVAMAKASSLAGRAPP